MSALFGKETDPPDEEMPVHGMWEIWAKRMNEMDGTEESPYPEYIVIPESEALEPWDIDL